MATDLTTALIFMVINIVLFWVIYAVLVRFCGESIIILFFALDLNDLRKIGYVM